MTSLDNLIDPYELLGLKIEATEQEIRTAYRQRSLKVHPDRNKNNPDAARKFHELNQAHQLLLDPLRRLALDAKLRLKEAHKARLGKYDVKRKVLVEELEEREREFKKVRLEKQKKEVEQWHENERIKEEGRRLKEERQKAMSKGAEERETTAAAPVADTAKDVDAPILGPYDTTVRLKYSLATHPTLVTPLSLSDLLRPFGATDTLSIVLTLKPPKKAPQKPPKYGVALVTFEQISQAFDAVNASGQADRGLGGVEVGWGEGKEPQILGWLKRMGKLAPPESSQSPQNIPKEGPTASSSSRQTRSDASVFSSFPTSFPDFSRPTESSSTAGGLDYESLTLLRLRQAEKEKLEREIRQQEGDE